jgi:uncharacterized protein (TIGR04206 family)
MTARVRLAAVALAGLVPWVVVTFGPEPSVDLVHSFGLVSPSPLHVTSLPSYLLVYTSGLPESLLAWPVASLLYGVALASAVSARLVGREDRRVTGGLLVLSGMSLLPVAIAVGRPRGVTALPVGTAALWLVAWWGYRGALVAAVTGETARER